MIERVSSKHCCVRFLFRSGILSHKVKFININGSGREEGRSFTPNREIASDCLAIGTEQAHGHMFR